MAVTCRAGREVIEAWVSVPAAKATKRNGDLPATSACLGVGYGEDLLGCRRQRPFFRENAPSRSSLRTGRE